MNSLDLNSLLSSLSSLSKLLTVSLFVGPIFFNSKARAADPTLTPSGLRCEFLLSGSGGTQKSLPGAFEDVRPLLVSTPNGMDPYKKQVIAKILLALKGSDPKSPWIERDKKLVQFLSDPTTRLDAQHENALSSYQEFYFDFGSGKLHEGIQGGLKINLTDSNSLEFAISFHLPPQTMKYFGFNLHGFFKKQFAGMLRKYPGTFSKPYELFISRAGNIVLSTPRDRRSGTSFGVADDLGPLLDVALQMKSFFENPVFALDQIAGTETVLAKMSPLNNRYGLQEESTHLLRRALERTMAILAQNQRTGKIYDLNEVGLKVEPSHLENGKEVYLLRINEGDPGQAEQPSVEVARGVISAGLVKIDSQNVNLQNWDQLILIDP